MTDKDKAREIDMIAISLYSNGVVQDDLRFYPAHIVESQRKELEELRKENSTLRALLGDSAKDCVYCGLPAKDQALCKSGFPGCARADDQMLSERFANEYFLNEAEKENKELRELCGELVGCLWFIHDDERLTEEKLERIKQALVKAKERMK